MQDAMKLNLYNKKIEDSKTGVKEKVVEE